MIADLPALFENLLDAHRLAKCKRSTFKEEKVSKQIESKQSESRAGSSGKKCVADERGNYFFPLDEGIKKA